MDKSNIDINNDLVKIRRWAYQWQILFTLEINKQVTEAYFSQRRSKLLPRLFSATHWQKQKTPGSSLGYQA